MRWTVPFVAVLGVACAKPVSVREPSQPIPLRLPEPSATVPVPARPVEPTAPACPPLAEWNGSRCAPKKVDCAAGTTWNGGWCLDPDAERIAGAAFARIDAEIHVHFAPDAPGYEYTGSIVDIVGQLDQSGHAHAGRYQRDAASAEQYDVELAKFIKASTSPTWKVAAIARTATLYDELWGALYRAVPPRVAIFTPAQIALLVRLANQAGGSALRTSVKEGWRRKKEALLAESSKNAVSLYAAALALARYYGMSSPQVTHAEERLAALTPILGDEAMREYVTHTQDPSDISGRTSLPYTPGMYVPPPSP